MTGSHDNNAIIVYWHRDLSPLDAELVAEHTVEASSSRIPWALAHRDEQWDQCYGELMTNTKNRLVEEVARLGGHYAHVREALNEGRGFQSLSAVHQPMLATTCGNSLRS